MATQYTKGTGNSFKHLANLVCVQQFCAVCEDDADTDVDCQRCGKKKHSFWTDLVSDLISYTFKFRPRADRIVAIARNIKAFDLLFVLNRLVRMNMLPEFFIMNGQKIIVAEGEECHVVGRSELPGHPTQKIT
jgi:hypothetical protein